jgi:hypothetical protein
MKHRSTLAGAALAALTIGLAPSAFGADTPETLEKMKAAVTPGEFVLTGSEVKKIHQGKEAREYRICVKAEKEAAPMKVMYDGQTATLSPGDCRDISGKKIEATPAQALSGSAHIVATYHHEKKKK